MIIGFAGPMGAGKTTAANYVNPGIVMSFATPLKSVCQQLFDFSDYQLYTLEGKETVDENWGVTSREVLQWLGTDCLRSRWPDFWIRLMRLRIKKYAENDTIVIDDVRFDDEAEFVRSSGGIIVHMVGRHANSDRASHRSEDGIMPGTDDYMIHNTGSFDDLRAAVETMVRSVKFGR